MWIQRDYLSWLREDFSKREEDYVSTDVTLPATNKSDRPREGEQRTRPDDGEVSPALEALRKYREGNVLLVGNPGLGKTTTIRRFMLEQALRAQDRPSIETPVLVEPKYLKSSTSIMGLITWFLNRCGGDISEKEISNELRSGRMLVLFDGLNELRSDDARADLSRFLEEFWQFTPMVFTSRNTRTAATRGVNTRLVMKGLSYPQREEFVRKSLGEDADKMLVELQKRSSTLGETPLLLKMLCDVNRRRRNIPHNLGLVFREWTEDYSELVAQEPRGTAEDRKIWPKIMAYLAFAMTEGESSTYAQLAVSKEGAIRILTRCLEEQKWGNPGRGAARFIDQLVDCHLLKESEGGQIEFIHQLVQEYYTAEKLVNILPDMQDYDLTTNWLNYVKWTEPICMAMELANDDDFQKRLLDLALKVDLVLSARLAGAAPNSSNAIEGLMNQDIPLKLKVDLLGRSKSEVALRELERALKDNNPMIREAAALAMAKSGISAASEALAQALFDKYPSVPWNAAEALRGIDASPSEESLLKALEVGDKNVRWAAAKALGGLRSLRVKEALINSLTDPEGNVRHKAAESLGVMSSDEAVASLLGRLGDPDWHVAAGAAEALGHIGSPQAERSLLKSLFHDHSEARKAAAKALDRLKSKKAWSILVDRLAAPNPFLRRCAAEGLENLNGEDTVDPLIKALTDDEPAVRWTAARALGEKRAKGSLPQLINLFSDPDVVLTALRSLGQLGSSEAVEAVEELQRNCPSDSEHYFACLETLARLGSSTAKAELLAMAEQDRHSKGVRATILLGELGCAEATEALFDLLSHETWLIRLRAADSLAELADDSLIQRLEELFDKTKDLLIVDLMSWIQQRCGFYNPDQLPWQRDFFLLHLSDLHFGNKDDAQTWFSALLLDIKTDLKPPRIDAVVISGDIVYGPQEEDGFEPATIFLRQLMAEYDVDPGSVVIVPGNHDLNLDATDQRLDEFRAFYSELREEEYPAEADDQATVHEFVTQRVLILGLNSAWEIDPDNRKRASIHQTAFASGIKRAIAQCGDQQWLKIVVWHHPLMSKWDDFIKDHDFVKTVSKAGFRIALHGHAHCDSYWEQHWHSEGFESVKIIGAGSFGVPPEGLVPAIPWQYTLYRIQGNRVTVRVRRKESGPGPWQAHNVFDFEI
ncbi:HEAT repeat domain-containing protein [Thermodesulfobacteriota bacterium]